MTYWVYMLLVGDRSHGYNRKIYTGYTQHLMQRIVQHSGLSNIKGARLTRKQPIELVYLEKHQNRQNAIQRERQFKKQSPYNQKKHKLTLIKEFQMKNGHLLNEINEILIKHFEFLDILIKTMNGVEKEFDKTLDTVLR
ncbi:MAG: GIY-YIG nuclease family protein [Candidatus Hodarchaeota archaeon]